MQGLKKVEDCTRPPIEVPQSGQARPPRRPSELLSPALDCSPDSRTRPVGHQKPFFQVLDEGRGREKREGDRATGG